MLLFVGVLMIGLVGALDIFEQSNTWDTPATGANQADNLRRGQTFTIGTVGIDKDINITQVALNITAAAGLSSGTLSVEIRNVNASSLPSNILGTANISVATLSSTAHFWTNITMDNNNTVLNASTQYALTLRCVSCDTGSVDWVLDSAEPYAGGIVVRSTDGGTNWDTQAFDGTFQIFGITGQINVSEIASSSPNSVETKTTTFQNNFTIKNNHALSSVEFIYDSVSQGFVTATLIDGSNYSASKTLDIPVGSFGTVSLSWNVTLNNSESQNLPSSHTVVEANLSLCGLSGGNVTFVNLTFKNETVALEPINSFIPISSWVYWLGTGLPNKTLSFSTSEQNNSFAFCFTPAAETVTIDADISYDNTESQQRNHVINLGTFTNITNLRTLYLLPTALGIFSKFQTVNNNGGAISGVLATISRTIGGSTVAVAIKTTDSSGFATIFLNPDIIYSAVFSQTAFNDNTFSFEPTADLRTVIMGGGATTISNGTSIAGNTTYAITPTNGTLNNETSITFGFNVTSGQTITLITMNITNSSGDQLLFQSNAGQGFISGVLNTGNNTRLIGYYRVETSEEVVALTKVWIVGEQFIGDYSLFRQMSLFNDFQFKDFTRMLLVLFFLVSITMFLTKTEAIENDEVKIGIIMLFVWGFSIVGWLDTGMVVNSASSTINNLGEFSSQFGIAILSTGAAFYFILRRVFILT